MAACFECPPGFFCYGDANVHRCDRGHYCPGNTSWAGQEKCPIGTYNPDRGLCVDKFFKVDTCFLNK